MNIYILKLDEGYAVCCNETVSGTVKATLSAARSALRKTAGRTRERINTLDNWVVTAAYGRLNLTGTVIEAYRA